jgi:ABC-type molybdate transport system permease subunit
MALARVLCEALVGRESEVSLLEDALLATLRGDGGVVIVGGNRVGESQTLASALLANFTYQPNDPQETAIALLLLALILVLIGALTVLQQRTRGVQLRFRTG